MKYMVFGPDYVIRLDRGDMVIASLVSLCEQDGIGLAWFSGAGGLGSAELTVPACGDALIAVDGPCEMVSISGNVSSLDGRPFIMAHVSLAGADGVLRGGLLKEAAVSTGCEIVLHRTFDRMDRREGPGSGIRVLGVRPEGE